LAALIEFESREHPTKTKKHETAEGKKSGESRSPGPNRRMKKPAEAVE
jgi:hypothetical protein